MCLCSKKKTLLGCVRQMKGDDPSPLSSTGETHQESRDQYWTPQYKKDMGILERVQRKAAKMVHVLEHLTHKEKLSEGAGTVQLHEENLQGDLIHG